MLQDELNSLDYFEHQLFITNSTSSLEYGVTYVLGAAFTFQQVGSRVEAKPTPGRVSMKMWGQSLVCPHHETPALLAACHN